MKNFPRRVRNFRESFDRLNGSDLVVGEHDGNNFRSRRNFFVQVIGIDCAGFIDGQLNYTATEILHCCAGIQNGFVLNGGSDDVRSFAQIFEHGGLNRPVVAFGAARREKNFVRRGVNASGNFFARLVQNFLQRARELISRRRVREEIFLQVDHQS